MTNRRASAAAAFALTWLATLAIGAPALADPASDGRPASASSKLQEEYPLHEPRRCCSALAPPGATGAVEAPRPGPGGGRDGWSPPVLLLIALLAGLALALVARAMPPLVRGMTDVVSRLRVPWKPRLRHIVSPVVTLLTRPLFRYSYVRDAYVLRLIGEHFGPVLRSRTRYPGDPWQPQFVSPTVTLRARRLFRHSYVWEAYVFKIQAGPALQEYGGPPDDDPNSFLATGEYGLEGYWAHTNERFVVQLGGALDKDVLASLGLVNLDEIAARGGSHGSMWLQPWAPLGDLGGETNVYSVDDATEIRVQYLPEVLWGRLVRPDVHPTADEVLERSFRNWVAAEEEDIVQTLREESGEMRHGHVRDRLCDDADQLTRSSRAKQNGGDA